ncbi:MAG: M48 family metallopeptidase [Rhodospirillales bacterium]|nr:M48 family metallopeptidase [Rhodospirillales bacterium]
MPPPRPRPWLRRSTVSPSHRRRSPERRREAEAARITALRADGPWQRRTSLVVAGREVALVVRRTRRARRLTLRLAAAGDGLVVTIPETAAFADGLALARANASWIATRIAEQPERVPFEDGRIVPLRGVDHRIRHSPSACGIFAEDRAICIGGAKARLAPRLQSWLRNQARVELAAEVANRAPRLCGQTAQPAVIPVGRISVRDTRSRWGSCAANGNLSFSWRLILAPPAALAYVVAHELAHLAHRDHSPRFWALVEAIGGDALAGRAWLKRHGAGLHRYG